MLLLMRSFALRNYIGKEHRLFLSADRKSRDKSRGARLAFKDSGGARCPGRASSSVNDLSALSV